MVGELFGEPSKSFTSTTTPTTFATLPEFGQEAFEQAVTGAQGLAEQPGLFAPEGLTPEQQASLGTLTSGLQPTSPEAFQTGLSTFGDPFQEQVIQNVIRDIQEAGAGQLSDIGSFASNVGGFGGTRQALLESELQKNVQRAVGDVSSQLRSRGFQAAADRTLQDISRAQGVAPTLFNLGDIQRQIQTQQKQAPLAASRFLTGTAQALPTGGGGVSSGTATGATQGILGQVAGGIGDIGTIAGGASALAAFSDKRLKENIECVGRENECNIYEFNYKNRPDKRFRGVLAQEIMESKPEAVSEVDGYLAVDYGMLNLRMEEVING